METRFFQHLADEVQIAPESIVSRTLQSDNGAKIILFAFDTGQELSEHTASVPAMIQILRGEADIKLGEDTYSVGEGAFASMPASLPHSIMAKTPVVMLLIMLSK